MGKLLTDLEIKFFVADNLVEAEEIFNKTM